MAVVIAMAGHGSRFSKAGYDIPKYKIRARNRSLFDWSLRSLSDFLDQRFVFACLDGEDTDWLREAATGAGVKEPVFHKRSKISRGQAETVFDALASCTDTEPLWIYNIDTYVSQGLLQSHLNGYDGAIPVFSSSSPSMSFVSYDEAGRVIRVAEKQQISQWATVGLYGFSSVALYKDFYEEGYARGSGVRDSKELYVAPLYEIGIARGKNFCAPQLSQNAVHILGTPAELLSFDAAAKPPIGA